jgi:sodium/potassium/calcium exchanger 6
VATIKRANSTQLYSTGKRDSTSGILRKRHTQASVPCISARRQQSADLLLPHRTPEGGSSNNANDYFTYISTNQNPPLISNDEPNMIPEIRLAPPIHVEQEQAYPNSPMIIEDNVSLHVPTTPLKQPHHQDDTLLLKESVSISIWLDDICCTLFPSLQDWNSKTSFAKLSALVAVPLVLVFTLTLPIAEGDDVKVDDIEVVNPVEESAPPTPQIVIDQLQPPSANTKSYLTVPVSARSLCDSVEEEPLLVEEEVLGWCRWLVATQAICASTFVSSVMACKFESCIVVQMIYFFIVVVVVNGFIPTIGILVGFLIGCTLSGLVLYYTKTNEAPKWHWMLSFVGFVIALNWIFLLANEMVGLLQALGAIFDISEAIMGLTIFALVI